MNYSNEFKEAVDNCVSNGTHIGTGNPNAKILFVGQEAAFEEKNDEYKSNAIDWQNHIKNNTTQRFNFQVDDNESYLRKTWGKNTWSKYQKLHDYIFNKKEKPFHIDFLENVFTTEMSDNPAKKTKDAQKKKDFKNDLQKRKKTFFKEDFIQNFSVIVLACSNYIENNPKNWELNELFKVEFFNDRDCLYLDKFKEFKLYSRGNWYFLHSNEDQTKLVIHTRQLSTNVNNELLKDMGEIIRGHLIKNKLL